MNWTIVWRTHKNLQHPQYRLYTDLYCCWQTQTETVRLVTTRWNRSGLKSSYNIVLYSNPNCLLVKDEHMVTLHNEHVIRTPLEFDTWVGFRFIIILILIGLVHCIYQTTVRKLTNRIWYQIFTWHFESLWSSSEGGHHRACQITSAARKSYLVSRAWHVSRVHFLWPHHFGVVNTTITNLYGNIQCVLVIFFFAHLAFFILRFMYVELIILCRYRCFTFF